MIKTKSFLLAAWLLLSFISLPRIHAATSQYGDIAIASQPPLPGRSACGYTEYSFILQNNSLSKAHRVTLELPKSDGMFGARIYPLSRTVNIAPQATVKLLLYQPHISLTGSGVRVIIDGSEWDSGNPLNFHANHFSYYNNGWEILVTKTAMSKNPPEIKGKPGYNYVLSHIPVSEWSDNWLAFSRYPLIITVKDDFAEMSPGARTALIKYAECGGILVIDGEIGSLNPWQKFKTGGKAWNIYSAGFGKIITAVKPFDKISHSDWERVYRLANSVVITMRTPNKNSVSQANSSFPVVKKINISPGIIFFIMLIFAILIGPVNIIVLTRKKRKIWLLWTVPAGALAFTLILMVYALVSENWGGYTRSRTLTVLDENSRRAISLGRLAYFYPIPPGGGLRFSLYTEVSTYGINNSNRIFAVDWTNGQHFKSGWLVAKTPCHLLLRKNESRRERLEVHRHNGKITVTNGLGAHIQKLSLVDFDRKSYTVSDLKPGAKAELVPWKNRGGSFRPNDLSRHFSAFDLNIGTDFKLVPGSYVAKLRRNPFVEPGRKFSLKHQDEATLVGIMRKEAAK